MKVCIIHSIFPPYARGGAEMVAYAAARAFSQAHDVFVITCAPFEGGKSFAGKWEGMTLKDTDSDGETRTIRMFRFTPLNLFTIFNIGKYPALLRIFWHLIDLFNLHTYLVVRKILREEKPDLILTHNLKGLGYTVPLAIKNVKCKIKNLKWLHTVHDMALLHPTGLRIWGQESSLMQKNLLVHLYAWCCKKLFGSPAVVISPSQFLLEEYRTRGFFPKSKTAVVRNPVLVQKTEDRRQKTESRPPVRFLYVGQLEPYKGLRLLLDVWRKFSAAHQDAELMIAGEGSLKEETERTAKSMARLQYRGVIPHDKLAEVFSIVHFTMIPSLAYENSPLSIGESFRHGVPVIASRIGGIPELVEDGVNGLLFEPGNQEALYGAMERATRQGDRLASGARKSVGEFTVEKYRAQIEHLI